MKIHLWLACATLTACAPRIAARPTTARPGVAPSAAEARRLVGALESEQSASTGEAAPATLDGVRQVIHRDQLGHFAAARDLLARDDSADARALLAELHLSWADALVGLADVFDRDGAQLRRQVTRQAAETDSAGDRRQLRSLEAQLAALQDRVAALNSVAAEHAAEGGDRARALPASDTSQRLLAQHHRLRRDWPAFDEAVAALHRLTPDALALTWLRALEAADRFGDTRRAEKLLTVVLARQPDHGRAHALLLRLQKAPDATHDQLGRLRRASPQHALVVWAGERIDDDFRAWEGTRSPTGP